MKMQNNVKASSRRGFLAAAGAGVAAAATFGTVTLGAKEGRATWIKFFNSQRQTTTDQARSHESSGGR